MNTSASESAVKRKQSKFAGFMPYALAGLGILNIELIFAPWLNTSGSYSLISVLKNPSLKVIFAGIASGNRLSPFFAVLAVFVAAAVTVSIVNFIMTVRENYKLCKYTVVSSAVFFLLSAADYTLNLHYFLANLHYVNHKLFYCIQYMASSAVPVTVMAISIISLIIAVLITQNKRTDLI